MHVHVHPGGGRLNQSLARSNNFLKNDYVSHLMRGRRGTYRSQYVLSEHADRESLLPVGE